MALHTSCPISVIGPSARFMALVGLVLIGSSLSAQTPAIQWKGTNGTFWNDDSNWSPPGAPRTHGRSVCGLIVNGDSELVYDSSLGTTVFGGVDRPAFVIGAGSGSTGESGILKITGGIFSGEGASGAESSDRIGSLGGRLIIDGGTYLSAPLGLALGDKGQGKATLLLQRGNARITSLSIDSPTSTIVLSGGRLELGRVRCGFPASTSSAVLVRFNGATLRALADETDFISLKNDQGRVEVAKGGLIFDTSGRKVSLVAALLHSSDPTDADRDGGLVKEGEGTLTLGGTNTFTGDIFVNRGVLRAGLSRNITNPGATALGNTQIAERKIYVNGGGTLDFAAADSVGSASSHVKTAIEVARGGLVCNPFRVHTRLGPLILNGGTLRADGGPRATFQAYSLDRIVTVGGTSPSLITSATGSNAGVHLSLSTEFLVADATSSPEPDLVVEAVLVNCNGREGGLDSPAALIKTGPGTLRLASANLYTGRTTVQSGVLELANPSALAKSPLDLANAARLVCVGKDRTFLLGGLVNQRGQTQTIDAAGNTVALAEGAVTLIGISGPPSDKPLFEVVNGPLRLGGELTVRFARELQPGTHVFNLFKATLDGSSFSQLNIVGSYSAQGTQSATAPGAEFVFDASSGNLRATIRYRS